MYVTHLLRRHVYKQCLSHVTQATASTDATEAGFRRMVNASLREATDTVPPLERTSNTRVGGNVRQQGRVNVVKPTIRRTPRESNEKQQRTQQPTIVHKQEMCVFYCCI
jgi:hypothetical protein